MRIAFVATGGFDRSGRHQVIPTLLALIQRLARRHQIFVYVLRYHDAAATYPLLGATIRDLGRPAGVRQQYRRLLAALREDGPFDLLHAYWGLPAGFVTTLAGRRLGVPAVVTCDSGEFAAIPDIDYGSQLHPRQRLAMRLTVKMARKITVCSEYQARLAAAAHCSPDVIPLGIESSAFIPGDRREGPPWRLLHVASLNPVKDQGTLLHAFKHLLDQNVDATLDIVGEDTMSGRMRELAAQLGIDGHVHFRGFRPSDALVPTYQRSHLFVLSSRHEAAGVVLLEAAACGVPVVGTAVGYIADWAPACAVSVPASDPPALAEAIRHLLADRTRRDRLSHAARAWTIAHDANWTATAFEQLYHRLTKPGS